MDSILKKSLDSSRGLLFGLLANCIFSTGARDSCPLSELRSNLSIEEKHKYLMGLSDVVLIFLLVSNSCVSLMFKVG